MPFKLSYYQDKLIDTEYKKSLVALDKFFEFEWKWNQPRIFVMDSRLTMNKYNIAPTPDWTIGWVSNKNVCILDGKKFSTDSSHTYSDRYYKTVIRHELVHCYTLVVSKDFNRPTWLWEGVAEYVSEGWKCHPIPKKFVDFLRYFDFHSDKKGDVYHESGYAVKILVEQYGKEKLLKLLKRLSEATTNKKFELLFKKIYGFVPTYEKFNDMLIHQS
jgi:hypothetical protein